MKTTTINTKCLPGARSGSTQPGVRHAHRRQRWATADCSARRCVPAPPGYTEAAADPQTARGRLRPRVLHIDADPAAAGVLSGLLMPEADVVHAATLADARRLIGSNVFSLLVLDPALPDGDARSLLYLVTGTPLLIYSAQQPQWRGIEAGFLPKPWTTARQLWTAISTMLGTSTGLSAGA